MTHRIAIISFKDTERTLLSKALSCMSGYQLVRNRTMYEWIRLYHIDEGQTHILENRFLLMSSSFIKRIKSEFRDSNFISDGAVFTEILPLESEMNENHVGLKNPEEIVMFKSLLNITGRYAAEHYDWVIHVQNSENPDFDALSVKFYNKYHIAYKFYDGDDNIINIMEKIIREVEIPMLQSAESAIYEAERAVNFKTWKS